MKKKGLLLIILFVIFALLLGGYFVLQKLAADKEEREAAEREQKTVVAELNREDIIGITLGTGEDKVSLYKADGGWAEEADKAFAVDAAALDAITAKLSPLTATRRLEGDAAVYGLTEPQARLSVKLSGGGSESFIIGSQNGVTGEYYIMREEDTAIYTVAEEVGAALIKSRVDIISREGYPAADAVSEDITALEIKTEEGALLLNRNADGFWYAETGDTDMLTDTDKAAQIASAANTLLKTEGFCAYEKSDLKKYGLLKPILELTAKYSTDAGEEEYCILVGKSDAGEFYKRLPGAYAVAACDANSVETVLGAHGAELASKMLLAAYITDIAGMTAVLEGKPYELKIERTPMENGGVDAAYMLNGEKLKSGFYPGELVTCLNGIIGIEDYTAPLPEKPRLTLAIAFAAGGEDMQLDFYEQDQVNAIAVVNGNAYTIDARSLEALANAVRDMAEAEKQ